MGGAGESNGLEGIGRIDANTAKGRLAKPNGWKEQQQWSQNYLNEHSFGLLVSALIIPIVFLLIWVFKISPILGWISMIFLISLPLSFKLWKEKRLTKLRTKQLFNSTIK